MCLRWGYARLSACGTPAPGTPSVTANTRYSLSPRAPEPVIRAVPSPRPKPTGKMGIALSKLAEEDRHSGRIPTARPGTIIAGTGELHLEIIVGPPAARIQGRGQRGARSPTRRPSASRPKWITNMRGNWRARPVWAANCIEPNEPGKGYELSIRLPAALSRKRYTGC